MLIKKQFQKSLDIDDAVAFCENKKNNTLLLLTRIYGGKCEDGVYIVKILEEGLYIGEVEINIRDNERHGVVNVKFTASVRDIITNCSILARVSKETKSNFVFAENEYIKVAIPITYNESIGNIDMSMFIGKTVQDNQVGKYGNLTEYIIPVKIQAKIAAIKSNKMTAKGLLYLPFAESRRYELIGEISSNKLDHYFQRIDEIKTILEKLAKDNAKNYKFFDELLYPFAKDRNNEIDRLSIQSIVNIANGTVSFVGKSIIIDPRIRLHIVPHVLLIGEDEKDDWNAKKMTVDVHQLIEVCMGDYIYLAELFIDMIGTYNDDLIVKHKALWTLYGNVKAANVIE